MENKYRLIILILSVGVITVIAGSYGWNTDPADDPRILEAFGSILGFKDANGSPSPCKQRDVSAAAMQWVNQQTADYERRKNMAAFQPSPPATTPIILSNAVPTATTAPSAKAAKKK